MSHEQRIQRHGRARGSQGLIEKPLNEWPRKEPSATGEDLILEPAH